MYLHISATVYFYNASDTLIEVDLTCMNQLCLDPQPHLSFHPLYSTSSLRVSLEVQQDMSVSLIVSYVVSNASWSSAYDVRVFTKDKAMKVNTQGQLIPILKHR